MFVNEKERETGECKLCTVGRFKSQINPLNTKPS